MQGKIIKGIAGFYLVDCGGEVLTCKARGLFRKRGEKPLVGDLAEVEAAQTSESVAAEKPPDSPGRQQRGPGAGRDGGADTRPAVLSA